MSPTKTIYAKENAIRMLDSIDNDFAVFETKFVTRWSATGSIMLATSESPSLNNKIFVSGEIIVTKISRMPVYPPAFFMSTLLAKIRLKPSDKYPPIVGMYDLIANFVALIEMPSKLPATIPETESAPKNIVKQKPVDILKALEKKSENLLSLTVLVKFPITLKTMLNEKIGKMTFEKTFIMPPLKITMNG